MDMWISSWFSRLAKKIANAETHDEAWLRLKSEDMSGSEIIAAAIGIFACLAVFAAIVVIAQKPF